MRIGRLEQQLIKARSSMIDENQAQMPNNNASSINVTAFRSNPVQSIHSASNIEHIVPEDIRRPIGSLFATHAETNVIGNEEDFIVEDHAQSHQQVGVPLQDLPFNLSRTPPLVSRVG